MNNKLLLLSSMVLFIVGSSKAQWQVYDCSLLPAEADTAWHESGDTPDGVTTILSVVDDPDIPGNKLLMVDESEGSVKEMWVMDWNSDPAVGSTIVFRCVALDPSTYERDFDIYVYNGIVRERLVSSRGKEIELTKSKKSAALNTTEWHIYRIIIIADYIEVYVDEDSNPYLGAVGEPLTDSENRFRFGDLSSSKIGSLYDWIIWDDTGAYPPGQGPPLPDDLTGLPTGIKEVNSTIPVEFQLFQNFPNPFNPVTEISFSLTKPAHTTLTVHNAVGQLISTLVNQNMNAGVYQMNFNASKMVSGVYFYQLKSGELTQVKKMMLMK